MNPTGLFLAAFGPLVVAGVIVAAVLASLHMFFQGQYGTRRLRRVESYLVGATTVGVTWTGLFLWRVSYPVDGLELLPVLDYWALFFFGMIPTVLLRLIDKTARHQADEQAAEEAQRVRNSDRL